MSSGSEPRRETYEDRPPLSSSALRPYPMAPGGRGRTANGHWRGSSGCLHHLDNSGLVSGSLSVSALAGGKAICSRGGLTAEDGGDAVVVLGFQGLW